LQASIIRTAARFLALGILFTSIQRADAQIRRAEAIVTTGSYAPGQVSVGQTGSVYWLRFQGDETIEYEIDTASSDVRGGILRVHEKSSDSWPLHYGQVMFRNSSGGTHSGYWLMSSTQLENVSVQANSIVFDFKDDLGWQGYGVHHRRYTYTLLGKDLRIRVEDPDRNTEYLGNYAGVYLARTEGTETPSFVKMQGGLAAPIVRFTNGGQQYFMSHMIDMYNTNASSYAIDQQPIAGPWETSVTNNLWTLNQYKPTNGSQMSSWLDDTYNVTISSRIRDVLVTPTQGPSPYRELLVGRTMVNMPSSTWQAYSNLWNLFESWGMDEVAGYFFDWSAPVPGSGQSQGPGPGWYPAKEPWNFAPMVQQGVAKGYLLGGYMAFNVMPSYAPPSVYNAGHIARDQWGGMKMSVQGSPLPLITTTASAIHALRESTLFKEQYGGNLAYLDIQSYASPTTGADGDHIDQILGSGWARTTSKAIRDQRLWMQAMQEKLEGPLIGEGSISSHGANLEWLWGGTVDSVQRCINTGIGMDASQVPAGSPDAPTNWPVIPEYELQVFSRLQANHGNGFLDRLLGPSDGPSMVNMSTGQTILPYTKPALDRNRIYEITYGHMPFVTTNGAFDGGVSNYSRYADVIQEHYMVSALSALYLEARPQSIEYLHNGSLQSFEQVLQQTGTTDSFRHAKLKIRYTNGLEVFLNHGSTPWSVDAGGASYTIPEDGFVAWQSGTQFRCFSAVPDGTNGARIDYCYAPKRYEFFDGRGNVDGWGNLSTGGVRRIKWQHFARDITGWETSSGSIQTSQGNPPACVRVDVLPANATLEKGARKGFRAIATFANGAIRNVTSLVDWSTSDLSVARVNDGAALKALDSGQATVHVTSFQGAPVTPATLTVQ
jgi:hypothetical protein